ncbi:MAG: hypothetical protein KKC23_01040, partial [Proteobacteria bacterium]|nr:hypothetical protein [Pseudomonadota bacterium]
LDRMATRNPSLGLTHHTYNRLQAGCYLTMDLYFKKGTIKSEFSLTIKKSLWTPNAHEAIVL